MSAITYMDHEKNFRTYRFSTIAKCGVSKDLYQKLRYAHEKLRKMLEKMFVWATIRKCTAAGWLYYLNLNYYNVVV